MAVPAELGAPTCNHREPARGEVDRAMRPWPTRDGPSPRDETDADSGPCRSVGSFPEEIGVGASAHQMQFVTRDVVDHEPIGLDVRLPVSLPNAPKRMIALPCG